jgi:hypothetical protein
MCEISDKIKFCTCVKGHYSKLPHYWLYYRVGEMNEFHCMGMPMTPFEYFVSDFKANEIKLAARLNESDAFDIPIMPKAGDRMEIVINNLKSYKKRVVYSFRYKKRQWMIDGYDPFESLNHRIKKIAKGPIRFEDSSSE